MSEPNTYSIINNPLLQDRTVAASAVEAIQQTLATVGSYTPTEVNTFLDWSYDAGDIVTLVKDGVNYTMPIFTNYLNWNGAHDVSWANSGNETRELPDVQERKSYGYGTSMAAAEENIATTFAQIEQTDNKVGLVVGTIDGENYIKAGEIVAEINDQTGQSTVRLQADKVELLGTSIVATGEFTSSDAIVVPELNCKYLYISGSGGEVGVDVESHFYGPVSMEGKQNFSGNDGVGTLAGPTVSVNTLNINAGEGGASYNLTTSNVSGMVTDLQLLGPTNNVYTLQKKTVANTSWADVGTFSRATSLSGVWSSGRYTVTASPQGEINVGLVYGHLVPDYSTVSKSGKTVSCSVIVYSDDGEGDADVAILTDTVSINASSVYDDGFDFCYDSITLSASSQTLSPGGSVTIYPKAKASSSASSATNITSEGITITAPTFTTETQSETITSNGTYEYTPSSGVDGMSKVTITVNVSGGGGGGSTVLIAVPKGEQISCGYSINDYEYEWMPVSYGGYNGYMMSKYVRSNTGTPDSGGTRAYKADNGYSYSGSITPGVKGTPSGYYYTGRCFAKSGSTVNLRDQPSM